MNKAHAAPAHAALVDVWHGLEMAHQEEGVHPADRVRGRAASSVVNLVKSTLGREAAMIVQLAMELTDSISEIDTV